MIEELKKAITGQYEAALCMLHQCIIQCKPEHWEGRIANDTFRQISYHTLFYVDFYLSPTEESFVLRDVHQRGGDERQPILSPGLEPDETLHYLTICLQKVIENVADETRESLEGPSGFALRKFSRVELHFYNIRHIQHHTGQLSAYLRRVDESLKMTKDLKWISSGWQ